MGADVSLKWAIFGVTLGSQARGGAYYRKKIDEGKTSKEALRCLESRVSDAVFRSLVADSKAPSQSAA